MKSYQAIQVGLRQKNLSFDCIEVFESSVLYSFLESMMHCKSMAVPEATINHNYFFVPLIKISGFPASL